jgi:hypothetical protein
MGTGTQAPPSPAQKVYTFAAGKLGRQVGSGECYDLADAALTAARGKSAPDFGPVTDDANYVWGKEVKLNEAFQGDIIQFRDHLIKITTRTVTKTIHSDGSWEEKTQEAWEEHERGHHTAVVATNNNDGTMVVFEQHVRPPGQAKVSLQVQQNTIYVQSKTMDPVTTVQLKGGARVETTTVKVIEVSGTIWIYRPQAK